MTVKPIIFSAPMVRALLAGRKTMTRRVLRPQPILDDEALYFPGKRRPYLVGDLLWVRERIAYLGAELRVGECDWRFGVRYHADDAEGSALIADADFMTTPPVLKAPDFSHIEDELERYQAQTEWFGRWWKRKRNIPAIHMPRWASRLTLEVTGVKVERLQNISEDDARAEGIAWSKRSAGYSYEPEDGGPGYHCSDPRKSFRVLWCFIHGENAWDENPWVCAISFNVHKINIDAFLKERAAA